jgi:hypothetical protein
MTLATLLKLLLALDRVSDGNSDSKLPEQAGIKSCWRVQAIHPDSSWREMWGE